MPTFPSLAWFNAAIAATTDDPTAHERLGVADLRFGVEVVFDDGHCELYGLVLDGYDLAACGPVNAEEFWPEVTVSGSLDTWREMVADIEAHGHADPGHTLNALSLANTPLEVTASDVMGQDKFYRFMGSLQAIFDAAGKVPAASS